MKYKVGDKVRVRSDLKNNKMYGTQMFVKDMEQYKGKGVTIKYDNNYYEIEEDEGYWHWTDEMFEGLAEDELTPEEAIRLRLEMCMEMSCCDCEMSKSNNNMGLSCNNLQMEHPERVIEILKQWKKDHEKKKEVETEFVYLIRVMKEEDDSTTCIYTYEVKEDKDDIKEKMDELVKLVKQYYEENGDKIYAKLERICRVKS